MDIFPPLADDIGNDDLLQASALLLAFGFMLPSALRRDRELGRGSRPAAIIAASAVVALCFSSLTALMGFRQLSAYGLLAALVWLGVLAFERARIHWRTARATGKVLFGPSGGPPP